MKFTGNLFTLLNAYGYTLVGVSPFLFSAAWQQLPRPETGRRNTERAHALATQALGRYHAVRPVYSLWTFFTY